MGRVVNWKPMGTAGHDNDGLMVVLIGVSVFVLVILAGGPAQSLQFVNDAVRAIVYQVTTLVSAWL